VQAQPTPGGPAYLHAKFTLHARLLFMRCGAVQRNIDRDLCGNFPPCRDTRSHAIRRPWASLIGRRAAGDQAQNLLRGAARDPTRRNGSTRSRVPGEETRSGSSAPRRGRRSCLVHPRSRKERTSTRLAQSRLRRGPASRRIRRAGGWNQGRCDMSSKKAPARVERSADTGKYVKSGTEKRSPSTTVTEPRKPKRK
jgi:hypothetical protein